MQMLEKSLRKLGFESRDHAILSRFERIPSPDHYKNNKKAL